MRWFFPLLLLPPLLGAAQGIGLDPSTEQLFRDLETAEQINKKISDQLPLIVNYQLQGGYFTMPSARTYDAGVLSFGFSYLPPYRVWNLGFQFFDHLETTGNYWIFKGIMDSTFGHLGFGDEADRGANVKLILFKRQDDPDYAFVPNVAIGMNDFLGTCRFKSFYAVATKEFFPWNLEATFGWGMGRIHGFFGGLAWSPWRHSEYFWKGFSFIAEYDANNYEYHVPEHTWGREVKSRINAGLQFNFLKNLRASVSSIRGVDWASSIALNYNLGETKGWLPKIYDPPPYVAPIDHDPLGILRSREEFAQELAFAFKEQGLDLYSVRLVPENEGKNRLWIKIINIRYWEEEVVRTRIERVLAALAPKNVQTITAVIEADGLLVHEYRFRTQDLKRYSEEKMGDDEFRIIAPLSEVSKRPKDYDSCQLYKRQKQIWVLTMRPWLTTFFGSSQGKFKYEVGLALGPEGYLWDQFYYCLTGTWSLIASTQNLSSNDILNPSKIINVRTDSLKYNQSNSFHVEQAYIQKSWNMGRGWFSRLGLGYFEVAYAGIAAEALYYPVGSNWAIGFEVAGLRKRDYFGLGFQGVRKLTSQGYQYFHYTGLQYFVDFYYEYKPFHLDFKVTAGQFLAFDKGIRLDASRMFSSGLRVGLWYTFTNANDVINGHRYYDKGFSITLPLDFFLNKSSRTRVGYSMAAWLRDCGQRASSGKQLYNTVYYERFNPNPLLN
ncbi:MAG: YjbH domain-containing protein [Verrucomicrobiota bacterium]|nr:YjbH domain-containing protein [Verrucomicrobiota bacterium]